jgi:hypothetical protein
MDVIRFVRTLAWGVLLICGVLAFTPTYNDRIQCGSPAFPRRSISYLGPARDILCGDTIIHYRLAILVMAVTAIAILIGLRKEKNHVPSW